MNGIKKPKKQYSLAFPESRPSTSKATSTSKLNESVRGSLKNGLLAGGDKKITDEEIEEQIRMVLDALPHLGDGKSYNIKIVDVFVNKKISSVFFLFSL